MKKLIILISLLATLAITMPAQSVVSGRAYTLTSTGLRLPIARTYVTVYDTDFGLPVAFAMTSSFGYYSVLVPCCKYYVISAKARIHQFDPPAFVFNTAFDNGEGFEIDFVENKSMLTRVAP
jgi:hypothetical protein